MDIGSLLADELGLKAGQVDQTLHLFQEGGTVPFVARYRKEKTGGLDEEVLRTLLERHTYLINLEKRKAVVLERIAEVGALTEALREKIKGCRQTNVLEDLYLPFKPRRRSRATKAREQGLDPLATWIQRHNRPGRAPSLEAEASRYVKGEVTSREEALLGASDILAEAVAENADLRAYVRRYLWNNGIFSATIGSKHAVGSTRYEMYRSYQVPVRRVPAHNLLALLRAEEEKVVRLSVQCDEEPILSHLYRRVIRADDPTWRAFMEAMVDDAFRRLMKKSLVADVRREAKQRADEVSINTFAANLRELLLASPAGMRPTLGIDPGFKSGCKAAVLDHTGKLLTYRTLFPHHAAAQRRTAAAELAELLRKYDIELVAVGNGTAGRETEAFVVEVLRDVDPRPICVMVSEAGASVYSASPIGREELPEIDVTVRGAVSIGRRLQDPLAELVKIDPKSIGVGQYQHDVEQARLRQKLEETVESCVNYVGVDVNMASVSLLGFVAGITPSLAKNMVVYRDAHGAFASREELRKVSRFGPKAFEQAAGFLRIREGTNPLDNTAVHPESYAIVEKMVEDLESSVEHLSLVTGRLGGLDPARYTTPTVGLPTVKDILSELEKPGRDPRERFQYATFREDVQKVTDLRDGMLLEGVVTNVANFGAFVDIGVHRDGLVHVSQLADRYVKDPHQVVRVGQVVSVRVLEVDIKKKRISLSMRSGPVADATSR